MRINAGLVPGIPGILLDDDRMKVILKASSFQFQYGGVTVSTGIVEAIRSVPRFLQASLNRQENT